ncbi:hypothetical protein QZJ86_05740 [Methylomonas montana]|uniref:hypothetical protein n=1 Tax=Methylomonas montana TaxID=3058963 RepID=UPI0026599D50|nr:hypothetical protein [Methylomonas montana]WKJ91636.1 hypothetical protein QZJ86_05740 [Methylomonas montana]
MNTQATPEIRPKSNTQTQPQNPIEAIRQKFMAIARSADMVLHEGEHEQLTGSALIHLQCDAEELAAFCRQMRDQLCGQSVHGQNGYTETPRKVSLDEVLAIQAIERGIVPMALEADLLIPRIEQGGHSGKFLADAFISSYRPHPFNHPLMELTRLDAEAFRLFHQILHIRHVPGWSDSALYEIEKRVRKAMKEGEKQNRRATRSGIAKAKAGLEVKGGE